MEKQLNEDVQLPSVEKELKTYSTWNKFPTKSIASVLPKVILNMIIASKI